MSSKPLLPPFAKDAPSGALSEVVERKICADRRMGELNFETMRVAFQGEPGAFSEAAAVQLLGGGIRTIPRTTFDATFRAIAEDAADALLVPVENTLAGSVVRVYDLLLDSPLEMCGETILPIEHHLMACPGATFADLRAVASHPVALAQCERFFESNPGLKRVPAEDTAGSVREMMGRGDKSCGAIAGRPAAERYGAIILRESIQDNAENFTRFVLLLTAGGSTPLSREGREENVAGDAAGAQAGGAAGVTGTFFETWREFAEDREPADSWEAV